MKAIFLFSIVALLGNYTFAQYQDINWVFGDSIGLNFATDPPTIFDSKILTLETCASISNFKKDLQFYTNGAKVWNSDNSVIQFGSDLDIWDSPLSSVSQGVIICNYPDNENQYYIFQKDYPLKYSIVDMCQNDGQGKVITLNAVLDPTLPNNQTEKLSAVRHGNGRDWLIILPAFPEYGGSDGYGLPMLFYIFLVSPDTIVKINTQEGIIYKDDNVSVHRGQCKFTSDGSMFGITHGRSIVLYTFDRCSGTFNHFYSIDSIFTGNPGDSMYGLEFSPDGTKLYATKSGGESHGVSRLFQYDLTVNDIKGSQIILRQDNSGYIYGSLQLAPNGKIYCAMPHDGIEYYNYDEPQNLSLSVINNPNEAGAACNYDHLAQYLGGKRVTYSLPNMPNYNLGVMPKSACDTLNTAIYNIQASGVFHIYPNPANEYIYISSETYKNEKCLLELYNATGTLVSRYEKVFVNETIQLPKLNEGVYLAVITTNSGKQFSEKLVITE